MNAKPDGNQLPPEQQEMPLIEHLLELRLSCLRLPLGQMCLPEPNQRRHIVRA